MTKPDMSWTNEFSHKPHGAIVSGNPRIPEHPHHPVIPEPSSIYLLFVAFALLMYSIYRRP